MIFSQNKSGNTFLIILDFPFSLQLYTHADHLGHELHQDFKLKMDTRMKRTMFNFTMPVQVHFYGWPGLLKLEHLYEAGVLCREVTCWPVTLSLKQHSYPVFQLYPKIEKKCQYGNQITTLLLLTLDLWLWETAMKKTYCWTRNNFKDYK